MQRLNNALARCKTSLAGVVRLQGVSAGRKAAQGIRRGPVGGKGVGECPEAAESEANRTGWHSTVGGRNANGDDLRRVPLNDRGRSRWPGTGSVLRKRPSAGS